MNYYNKIIHILGIPSIVWAVFLYTHRFKTCFGKVSTLLYGYYLYKYFKIDKARFLRIGLFYYILLKNSHDVYITKKYKESRNLAINVFVLGWILQFIGHAVFEKKSPALFNGFTKSITIGPFFAYKHLEELVFGS